MARDVKSARDTLDSALGPLTSAKKVDFLCAKYTASLVVLSCGQLPPCDELFDNKVAGGNRMLQPTHASSSRSFDARLILPT
jgi:hypothetical protein